MTQEHSLPIESITDIMNIPKPAQWTIPDLLPYGGMTMIHAAPKLGKSLFLWSIAAEMESQKTALTQACDFFPDTLILTEESYGELQNKFAAVDLTPHSNIQVTRADALPAEIRPWNKLVEQAAHAFRGRLAETGRYFDLLVIDTMMTFALSYSDTNDFGGTAGIMEQFSLFRGMYPSTSILILHHSRKGSRGDVDDAMGSAAFAAACDAILSFTEDSNDTTVRHLRGRTRWGGEFSKAVQWRPDLFRYVPIYHASTEALILQLLQAGGQWTVQDLLEELRDGHARLVHQTTIQRSLTKANKEGLVGRSVDAAGQFQKRGKAPLWQSLH